MTPEAFVKKWSKIQVKESSDAQSHFNDICALIGHKPPLEADPLGEFFLFEAATARANGRSRRADVWYRGKFIWEYKGPHANLDKAYQQLQLYRESLGNPYLLIVSDIYNIIIHTNFPNTIKETHHISFERILNGEGVPLLRSAFYEPDTFLPSQTQAQVTEATADTFVSVLESLKKHQQVIGQQYTPEQLARFVTRLLFCLFAEDLFLLPHNIFTHLVKMQNDEWADFSYGLRHLFQVMRSGGVYGFHKIPYFDGGLFDDDFVPDLPPDLGQALRLAVEQNWSGIDPSIFGTLFERVIDEAKRAQLGAHYTSKEDILLIVEPVLMKPLRDEWIKTKRAIKASENLAATLHEFANKLSHVQVLDPACGSGNFLYVALHQLLDLQKEVIVYARDHGLPEIPLTISPAQLYGIEINPYAHELAQITVWIGYLQWRYENGFRELPTPILQPLKNILYQDAVLAYDENGHPTEPVWPTADFVIGNPPFLGGQKLLRELGEKYVRDLRNLYQGRVPQAADLVAYWFERSRTLIANGKLRRAGLLATQSIRGEASRPVLEQIKTTGDIFLAWSDRPWILEGAAVRVSIIGFDNGDESTKMLDGVPVANINANLTGGIDLTQAKSLKENDQLGYMGIIRVGPFELTDVQAKNMLAASNKDNTRHNQDVIKPWIRARDVVERPQNMWIIDFGVDMLEEVAELYEEPFAYVQQYVKPLREQARQAKNREEWWLFEGRRTGMREAINRLQRYIVTPLVSKYRLFAWQNTQTIPDARVIALAWDDDYFLGVLHSKAHELWSLHKAARHGVGNDPTYNVSTCFMTFPFPWPPGKEPTEAANNRVFAIAQAARELCNFRDKWLNPPGIGITLSQKQADKRTLTHLYNALEQYRQTVKGKQRNPLKWEKEVAGLISLEQIEDLDAIHGELDKAVFAAYGWPATQTDVQILSRLFVLNLERAV